MYWISLALIWNVAAADFYGGNGESSVYMGYHRTIGIPQAAKIKEMETKIMKEAKESLNTRIIGGYRTTHDKFPWLVGLVIYMHDSENAPTKSMCGGAFLDKKRVLTAAHCIMEQNYILENVEVVFGSDYLYYGGVRFLSNVTKVHDSWIGRNEGGGIDIGMVFIKEFYYYEWDPLLLPTMIKDETFAGYSARTAGYGFVFRKPKYDVPETKNVVEVNIQHTKRCTMDKDKDWWLCTAGLLGDGKVGSCHGDSGGPLIVTICGKFVLVGIVVHNLGECEDGNSTYYTRITKVLDFIEENKLPS